MKENKKKYSPNGCRNGGGGVLGWRTKHLLKKKQTKKTKEERADARRRPSREPKNQRKKKKKNFKIKSPAAITGFQIDGRDLNERNSPKLPKKNEWILSKSEEIPFDFQRIDPPLRDVTQRNGGELNSIE